MGYEWDEEKRRINQGKHGIDFSAIGDFNWGTVVTKPDFRHAEPRTLAYGLIGARLYVVVFTERNSDIRIISMRKANPREEKEYEHRRSQG